MNSFDWKFFGYISLYYDNHKQKEKTNKERKFQKQAYSRVDLDLGDS